MERKDSLRVISCAALRLADGGRAACRLCDDAETVTRADAAAYQRCMARLAHAAAAVSADETETLQKKS